MKVLLIGSGGREHALAWKLAQSPVLDTLWACPGNPGIAETLKGINDKRDRTDEAGEHGACFEADLQDHGGIIAFCRTYAIDLVVVGPEQPLVEGLGDALRAAGIPVFGPNRIPAQLEGSKGFTKDLCAEHGIPTARYVRVTDRAAAEDALAEFGLPVVLKADGLAAGKGVIIAETAEEARSALDLMFEGGFGSAGASVVIEEFMTGEEVSFFCLVDGETVLPFGSAQDHKRVGDGDTGPNTGGMGAYSPASIFTPDLERRALEEIVRPTARALAAAGTPFSGILYAGLMLTSEGPKLVEYNVRFGDPECQVLMARLESDLLALILATAKGALAEAPPPVFSPDPALVVVVAAKGYPGTPVKGGRIAGLDTPGATIFHAGTAFRDGALVASGGRVLGVTACGATVAEAQRAAYAAADAIDFADGFCRRDIGWREIARGSAAGV